MKSSFLSIRIKIIIALTLLLSALILLSYFYITSLREFSSSHRLVVDSDTITQRVANLERDVVDIQRNVFIYKESYSNTAKNKVDKLYSSVMQQLQEISKMDIAKRYDSNLVDIKFYLTEYYNNFNVVSDYVRRLERIRKNLIDGTLFPENDRDGLLLDVQTLEVRERLIEQAKIEILLYLVSSDGAHIEKAKPILKEISRISGGGEIFGFKNVDVFIKELNDLVNIKRNYTYLISVVMAGNANEILYNSNFLTKRFSEKSSGITDRVDRYVKNQTDVGILISAVGIVLAVIFGGYFFWLITQPIISIAKVFDLLSKGYRVNAIPGLNRKDEIGVLAKSAAVFKQKNEQTLKLLDDTRQAEQRQLSLNKELGHEKNKAENALKVRTNFLANMSHELRTPLNSIIGFTVRLIKTSEKEGYKHLEVLKTIQRNGHHLLSMINDILDLSKIEENKLELSVSTFDLSALLKEVIEQIAVSAEEKDLAIIVEAVPVDIESDRTRLTQVLLNLLSNSVKYTEQGAVTCLLQVDDSNGTVDIVIEDTGIGIKDDDLARLFTRFEQFSSDRNSKIGFGTGLGLAIVDNVTHLLGGKTTATSEYGVGSRFVVTLPLKFSGRDDAALPSAEPSQKSL